MLLKPGDLVSHIQDRTAKLGIFIKFCPIDIDCCYVLWLKSAYPIELVRHFTLNIKQYD